MTRKRAKSADQASLGTAGTLEAGCNGSMALPRTRLELHFRPYRGSSAECRIRSGKTPLPMLMEIDCGVLANGSLALLHQPGGISII